MEECFYAEVILNGHPTERLPNTLNVSFPDRLGHELLEQLVGVAASTGSACHSGSHEMSPVLKAMGLESPVGLGAIRFSVGRPTTEDEIEIVVGLLRNLITPTFA